jgi:hypothetical protein
VCKARRGGGGARARGMPVRWRRSWGGGSVRVEGTRGEFGEGFVAADGEADERGEMRQVPVGIPDRTQILREITMTVLRS